MSQQHNTPFIAGFWRTVSLRRGLPMLALATVASALTSCQAPSGNEPAAKVNPPAAVSPDDARVQQQAQAHADRVAAAMQRHDAFAAADTAADVPVVQWLDERLGANVAPRAMGADAVAGEAMIIDADPSVLAPAPVVLAAAPAPTPASAPATASRDELAAALLDAIRASDDPALHKALAAAALSLVQRQQTLETADTAALEPSEKQAVRFYHALLTELTQRIISGKELDSASLMSDLQSGIDQGPLAIRQVALCRNVRSYGVYETFDSQTFLAGREQPMIVYVELDRYQAQKGDEGQYEVRLQQEIELYNEADGLAVWQQPAVEIVDKSRNRRRDFFVVQMVRLPARLSVGKYLLKVRVHDKHGGSIDETTLPIQMVADTALVKQ